MKASSQMRSDGEVTQSDSVLIPENTLQSLLGVSGPDFCLETSHLADENGWTAKLTPHGHWLFERKSMGSTPHGIQAGFRLL
jgi:hypothetical protein